MVNNALVRSEYNTKLRNKWLIKTLLYRLVCVFGVHSFAVHSFAVFITQSQSLRICAQFLHTFDCDFYYF